MKKEIILNILKAAVRAPSGDNSQPWRFEVSNNNNIKIYNLPEKDNPIFNYKQRGSHIAHGALIENIIIAAKENGMNVKVNLFPQGTSSDFIAEIDLLPDQSIKKDPLFFIFSRCKCFVKGRRRFPVVLFQPVSKTEIETYRRILFQTFEFGNSLIYIT